MGILRKGMSGSGCPYGKGRHLAERLSFLVRPAQPDPGLLIAHSMKRFAVVALEHRSNTLTTSDCCMIAQEGWTLRFNECLIFV